MSSLRNEIRTDDDSGEPAGTVTGAQAGGDAATTPQDGPLDSKAVRRESYLDAARECILDVGWRRTTLTEVARRADVSRMTMYRTWPDMSALIGDLMTREWTQITSAVRPSESAAEFARTAVDLVRSMRENELLARILEVDPEILLPYLLQRPGRSQELVLALIEAQLRAGQESGWVRAADPHTLARGLVLAVHGFALSSHTMVDESTSRDDLDDLLADIVARTVAP